MKTFIEYVKQMAVEKPEVKEVPDYEGPENKYVKKVDGKKQVEEKGKDNFACKTPKVEKVPDFHGEKNPEAKGGESKAKNVKKNQVVD